MGGVVVGRQSALASTVIALTLATVLAGCVGPFADTHLSRLNAPNLRYLSALTGTLDGNGYFRIAAVFDQRGSTEPQVLTSYRNNLEVIGLDGRGDRLIPTDGGCKGDAAVSPDGLWAACVFLDTPPARTALPTYKLEITSLSPQGRPVHHSYELGGVQSSQGPVWSPNGLYLAVGVACSVEIFTAWPPYAQPTLVGRITSDALVNDGACAGSSLSWSPDSAELRFGFHPQLAYKLDDHISLARVLTARGGMLEIPASDFVPFPAGEATLGPIWRPNDSTAVVSVNGTNVLLYYTGTEQPPQVLLTMPDAAHHVLGASWTPDGRQLVLTIGSPPCVDACQRVVPDVYLLTPTLST